MRDIDGANIKRFLSPSVPQVSNRSSSTFKQNYLLLIFSKSSFYYFEKLSIDDFDIS